MRDDDCELVPDPLAQIDDPPANHAVHRRDRSVLHHCCQRSSVLVLQAWRLAGCLTVDQTVCTLRIEPQHPIAHDLQRDAAHFRRLRPAASVIDRSQRQQPSNLISIPALACDPTQLRRIEVQPQRDRLSHGELPPFASLQPDRARVGESPSLSRYQQALV